MDQSFITTKTGTQDCCLSMNVRFVQQVKIRIGKFFIFKNKNLMFPFIKKKLGEAKNLQPKNGTNSLKDCYCVISLDREEIFRTHNSIDKTLE